MRILPFSAGVFALLGSLVASCLVTANTAMAQNAPNINVTISNSASGNIGTEAINCLSVTPPCVPYSGTTVHPGVPNPYTVVPNNTRPFYDVTYGGYFNGVHKSCTFQATNYPIKNGQCDLSFWAPSATKTNGTGTSPNCTAKVTQPPQLPSCALNVTFYFAE